MRRLLAISGKRFSGKSTLAAMICELARTRGVDMRHYAFADERKRMFAAAQRARGVEVDADRLSDDRAYKEKWRPQMTEFTFAAMQADPQVFVREIARRIEADPHPALISDLRLRVEVDWLVEHFDLVSVRVVRSDPKRAQHGWVFDADRDDHYTETELDDYDGWTETVMNQSTLEDLNGRAADILTALSR